MYDGAFTARLKSRHGSPIVDPKVRDDLRGLNVRMPAKSDQIRVCEPEFISLEFLYDLKGKSVCSSPYFAQKTDRSCGKDNTF